MVYVAISRDNQRTPIEQADPNGRAAVLEVRRRVCTPEQRSRSTSTERGHPIASLRDIPAGEYWMQPFVNVYTRFPRADGKTVWLHMDQWEGQNWKRSPGQPLSAIRCRRHIRSGSRRRRSGSSPTR